MSTTVPNRVFVVFGELLMLLGTSSQYTAVDKFMANLHIYNLYDACNITICVISRPVFKVEETSTIFKKLSIFQHHKPLSNYWRNSGFTALDN